MTKEKTKNCIECLKQIKIAKKFGQFDQKLLKIFLLTYDVSEEDLEKAELSLNLL